MPHVFIASSNARRDPVTLVARHADEAFRLLYLWRERHAPLFGPDLMISQVTPVDLARQPLLADLARSGGVGVAWWKGDDRGWVLGPPDGDALGEIAPPAPPVECFVFTTMEAGGTYVVAETQEQAIATLNAYSQAVNGWDAKYGKVVVMSVWLLNGSLATLREDMFAGKVGVARECEDGFWRVFPASLTP